MARTRKTRQFSGLDFATRTAIAWIGAWLPLWILFDAIDVEIPLFLLPVVIVLAVVLKASGYTSVKTRRVLRVALAVGVAAAVLILHRQTAEGFRICYDSLAQAVNAYYGTEWKLFGVESFSSIGVMLFLLPISIILLFLSDMATDGRAWVPWLGVSFLFPWTATLVDAFCPIWYLCLYAGLVVYFLVTSESHGLRVGAGARYRIAAAIGIGAMFLVANLLITQDFYDDTVRNWKERRVIGDYLMEHFPNIFGPGQSGGKGDISGISNGKLPTSGRLQYSNKVLGTVTLPMSYGTLYLRTGAYGEYTGTAWVPIEDYMDTMGANSEEFLFTTQIPVAIERRCTEWNAEGADNLRFLLKYAKIDVSLSVETRIAPMPYFSVLPEIDDIGYDPEGYGIFREAKKWNYSVRCYYNPLRLPASAAYAENMNKLTATDLWLSDSEKQLLAQYRDYVYEHYLTVPDSCRSACSVLMNDPAPTVFDYIQMVQSYLNYNYAYTTRPGETPKDRDFIDYFLTENKKGYCSYFASAAVMMFRAKGIPARYVEGFSVEGGILGSLPKSGESKVTVHEADGVFRTQTEDMVTVELTDQFAHAWVEVFLDGYGWYPVEVTTSNAAGSMAQSLKLAREAREVSVTPTPKIPALTPRVTQSPQKTPTPKATVTPGGNKTAPTGTPGKTPTGTPGGEPSESAKNAANHLRILLKVLLVVVLVAAPVVFLGLRYSTRQRIRQKMTLRSDSNASIGTICRDIGRVFRARGVKYNPCETDASYLTRAGGVFGHTEDLLWLNEIANRAAYSGEKIDREDHSRALSIYRVLRKETLAAGSLPKRLYLKYIRII